MKPPFHPFEVAEACGVFCPALVLAEPAVVVAGLVSVHDGVEVDGACGGQGLAVGVVGRPPSLFDGLGNVCGTKHLSQDWPLQCRAAIVV